MLELTVCTHDGHVRQEQRVGTIVNLMRDLDTLFWLDVVAPNDDDIQFLGQTFSFHPLAIEDVIRGRQRPKVDTYDHYYFVVFYCIGMGEQEQRVAVIPLYLFIGQNYVVTVHPAQIAQIQQTLDRWRKPNWPLGRKIGGLVYGILDAVVDEYFPVIDRVADQIEEIEQQIFDQFNDQAIGTIFNLKKDLLVVRRVVAPERDVLNVMLRRDLAIFDEHDATYLQDVYDHIVRITDNLDTYRDLLSSSLDTYLSVQSNKLNQVVKVLTIASIVLMSAALIAGIYGMNFQNMPELSWRYGYAYALGLMVVVAGSLILWFRHIKWL